MSIVLLIIGIVLFIGLVVVHEFGHFLAARRKGVVVEEFGIGFPPIAWGKTLKSGMLFTINWLPLGGFVRLKGEHDSSRSKGSYGAASLKTKVEIMLAGVGMNLITAFVLFTLLALIGMPKLIENQFTVDKDTKVVKNEVLIGTVEKDSPAAKAGLKPKDQILHFHANGTMYEVTTAEALPKITKQLAGKDVEVHIKRSGVEQELDLVLRSKNEVDASLKTNNPKGYLGISPTEYTLRRSTWSSPIVAAGLIKQFTWVTLKGLGSAVGNLLQGNGSKASSQVSGPIGIFVLLKDGSLLGIRFILMIVAIISLTLAIMNILPIPALDGGRLFVTLAYRLFKKPLTEKAEDRIHGTGFAVLMLLIIVISVIDVRRYF